jgi:hypothetical protein
LLGTLLLAAMKVWRSAKTLFEAFHPSDVDVEFGVHLRQQVKAASQVFAPVAPETETAADADTTGTPLCAQITIISRVLASRALAIEDSMQVLRL